MKNIIILIVIVLLGIGAYLYLSPSPKAPDTPGESMATSTDAIATSTAESVTKEAEGASVIGTSVEGRDITAYHFGTGDTRLLFVGGLHGGYEWNTVLLAYNLIDYLDQNPGAIAANESVTIIPVANPDGLNAVVGKSGRFTQAEVPASVAETIPGRFNANKVDLNRNFDCEWQATGIWQNKSVSGGSAAFSEPESRAIKAYIEKYPPNAAVVWYSAAGGVYASDCRNGILPETSAIMKAYADASGYPAHETFDFYETTGDMVNWFAKLKIPAISVLLTNHQNVEWDKNLAGITALLKRYAK